MSLFYVDVMESIMKSEDSEVINLADPEIIALSDCDSDSDESSVSVQIIENEPVAVIDLVDRVEQTNADSDIILINDSVVSTESPTVPIVIDTTPNFNFQSDFIHVPLYSKLSKKKKQRFRDRCRKLQLKQLNQVPEQGPNQKPDERLNQGPIQKQDPETDQGSDQLSKKKKLEAPNQENHVLSHHNVHERVRWTPVIQLCYPNILNSNAEEVQRIGLRPIIIDGCNVGFGYGNGEFKMQGVILVIQYFKNRGHKEIVCFLPNSYRHRVRSPSEERMVASFEKDDIFTFTPSRRFDNGVRITPYDDRYILTYASERQGVIVSNDGYLDLINEEPSWRETIQLRVLNYTFARGLLMLPKDPLGPRGPTLDEMLRFP